MPPFAIELSSSDGLDQDCGGTDGTDPAVPGPTNAIQAALDAAEDGQVIWVGPGNYAEHDLDFKGKAVALISTHGQEQTVIDAGGLGPGFYFHTGESNEAVLNGFCVTNGYTSAGGGITFSDSSPSLIQLTVIGNSASNGGGMYLDHSNASLNDVTVTGNSASNGGGMYLELSSPTLSRVTVGGNSAERCGGGMLLRDVGVECCWWDRARP